MHMRFTGSKFDRHSRLLRTLQLVLWALKGARKPPGSYQVSFHTKVLKGGFALVAVYPLTSDKISKAPQLWVFRYIP